VISEVGGRWGVRTRRRKGSSTYQSRREKARPKQAVKVKLACEEQRTIRGGGEGGPDNACGIGTRCEKGIAAAEDEKKSPMQRRWASESGAKKKKSHWAKRGLRLVRGEGGLKKTLPSVDGDQSRNYKA